MGGGWDVHDDDEEEEEEVDDVETLISGMARTELVDR